MLIKVHFEKTADGIKWETTECESYEEIWDDSSLTLSLYCRDVCVKYYTFRHDEIKETVEIYIMENGKTVDKIMISKN